MFVGACIVAGLVGGEGFAVDASVTVLPSANKRRSISLDRSGTKNLTRSRVSRATKKYLATLDDAALGAASDDLIPKFVSPSDPAAQWTGAMQGTVRSLRLCRQLIWIDVKFGMIMDVEASRAIRQAEVQLRVQAP